jgi:hypothetical protein
MLNFAELKKRFDTVGILWKCFYNFGIAYNSLIIKGLYYLRGCFVVNDYKNILFPAIVTICYLDRKEHVLWEVVALTHN